MATTQAAEELLKSVVCWERCGVSWDGLAALEQETGGDDDGEDGDHDGEEAEAVVDCPGHDDVDLPIVR